MVEDPVYVAIALGLILLNGFFVAAEFSMVRVRATRISERAEEGDWRAKAAEYLIAHMDGFLPATQLAITLTSLGLGWVGEPAFEGLIRPAFNLLGIASPSVVEHGSAALAFMTITCLHIVVGELAPKSYAIRATERVALWTALPMRVFQFVFSPQKALNTDINDATIRILQRSGCEVVIARGMGCCGALTHHMGKADLAQASAAANIRAWMAEKASGRP